MKTSGFQFKSRRNLMLVCLIETLLLASSVVVQAQLTFVTNNGSITITGYTGTNGNVVIPDMTNGYPVTCIGESAFEEQEFGPWNLTSITVPDSVTNIGDGAFGGCENLTNATIGNGIITIGAAAFAFTRIANIYLDTNLVIIGDAAFSGTSLNTIMLPASVSFIGNVPFFQSYSLTNITVDPSNSNYSSLNGVLYNKDQTKLIECPNGLVGSYSIPSGVTDIGNSAFDFCALAQIYIPASVTNLEWQALGDCGNLTGLFFAGTPPVWNTAFFGDDFSSITFFYIPGTSGWLQLAPFLQLGYWFPNPTIPANVLNFGIQNNQFGFTIVWATNVPVIVDACTNLENPQWQPLQTNIITDSAIYFTDPQWTNYPSRFYRLRSP